MKITYSKLLIITGVVFASTAAPIEGGLYDLAHQQEEAGIELILRSKRTRQLAELEAIINLFRLIGRVIVHAASLPRSCVEVCHGVEGAEFNMLKGILSCAAITGGVILVKKWFELIQKESVALIVMK